VGASLRVPQGSPLPQGVPRNLVQRQCSGERARARAAIKGGPRHWVESATSASLPLPLRSPVRPTSPPPLSECERREAEISPLRRLPLRSPSTSPKGTPLPLLKMPPSEGAPQPHPLDDHGLDDGVHSYDIPR